GGSETLQEIGFIDLLKSGNHTWNNLKDKIMAEKDEARQAELRIQSVLSEYFLGSVHAIAETGELVFASATGSQLPSYAYTCRNVIWVAGTQKIVPTLADAIQRVEEYVLPREDARMKREGYSGSVIGKLLIVKFEIDPNRNLKLILVPEKLGF
ncbi:MAG TPA: LUD domain-containing protein, partial [archaeon]|nr:LUD domain-containing protein [archaeon]